MCSAVAIIFALVWVSDVLASDSCSSMTVDIRNGTLLFPNLQETCSECKGLPVSASITGRCTITPLNDAGRGLSLRLEELCACSKLFTATDLLEPTSASKSTTTEMYTSSTEPTTTETTKKTYVAKLTEPITTETSIVDPTPTKISSTTNSTVTDIHASKYSEFETTLTIKIEPTINFCSTTTDLNASSYLNLTKTSNRVTASLSSTNMTTTDLHTPFFLDPTTTETSSMEPRTADKFSASNLIAAEVSDFGDSVSTTTETYKVRSITIPTSGTPSSTPTNTNASLPLDAARFKPMPSISTTTEASSSTISTTIDLHSYSNSTITATNVAVSSTLISSATISMTEIDVVDPTSIDTSKSSNSTTTNTHILNYLDLATTKTSKVETTTDSLPFSYPDSTTAETNITEALTTEPSNTANATIKSLYIPSYSDSNTTKESPPIIIISPEMSDTSISTTTTTITDMSIVSNSTTYLYVPSSVVLTTTETSKITPTTTEISSSTIATDTDIHAISHSASTTKGTRIAKSTSIEISDVSNGSSTNLRSHIHTDPTTTETSIADSSRTNTISVSNDLYGSIYWDPITTEASTEVVTTSDISKASVSATIETTSVSNSTKTDLHVPSYVEPTTTETSKVQPTTAEASSASISSITGILLVKPLNQTSSVTSFAEPTTNMHTFTYSDPETSTAIDKVKPKSTVTSSGSSWTATKLNTASYLIPSSKISITEKTTTEMYKPIYMHVFTFDPTTAEESTTETIGESISKTTKIAGILHTATTDNTSRIITTTAKMLSSRSSAAEMDHAKNKLLKPVAIMVFVLLLIAALIITISCMIYKRYRQGSYDVRNSPMTNDIEMGKNVGNGNS